MFVGVPLHGAGRPLFHRLLHHAAEEEPRPRRTHPRQGRPRLRLPDHASDGGQGPAAGLQQGSAGGQGGRVRRAGYG